MATLVTIPTGVQNRRGSDGSGFAIGKQTAAGVALTRVNYESTAGTDAVGDGFPAGRPIRFFLDDGGYGPITLTTSANTVQMRCLPSLAEMLMATWKPTALRSTVVIIPQQAR